MLNANISSISDISWCDEVTLFYTLTHIACIAVLHFTVTVRSSPMSKSLTLIWVTMYLTCCWGVLFASDHERYIWVSCIVSMILGVYYLISLMKTPPILVRRYHNLISTILLLNGYFHIKPVLCPRQSYWVEVEATPRAYTADRGPIRLYKDIMQALYENTHFMTPLLTNDLTLQLFSYFFVVVLTIQLIKTWYDCMMT